MSCGSEVIVSKNKNTEVIYINTLPSAKSLAENSILIFDSYLLKVPVIKKWLQSFPNKYAVDAGETLKQLSSFEVHVQEILTIAEKMKVKNVTFIAVGGGSIGDFVGFLASVFKRGVPLIHIPSTWLAAIDSSHGGKTALNAGGFKNQIGTFYPASQVIICKALLFTQPTERVTEAMGEVLKTALLAGGKLWKDLSKERHIEQKKLWRYLPDLIAYKYKIVSKDPFEKKGLRFFLNFGHTFGHVFEISQKLPHGVAVNWGLVMALEFSFAKKIITFKQLQMIYGTPLMRNHLADAKHVRMGLMKTSKMSSFLLQDKKGSEQGLLNFVFLVKPGKPQVLKTSVAEMIAFATGFQG